MKRKDKITIILILLFVILFPYSQVLCAKPKPDLFVAEMNLNKDCKLWIKITNKGKGRINSLKHKQSTIGLKIGKKSLADIKLSEIDPKGKLTKPNGSVMYNTQIKLSKAKKIKLVLDNNKKIRESDETNNIKSIKLIPDCGSKSLNKTNQSTYAQTGNKPAQRSTESATQNAGAAPGPVANITEVVGNFGNGRLFEGGPFTIRGSSFGTTKRDIFFQLKSSSSRYKCSIISWSDNHITGILPRITASHPCGIERARVYIQIPQHSYEFDVKMRNQIYFGQIHLSTDEAHPGENLDVAFNLNNRSECSYRKVEYEIVLMEGFEKTSLTTETFRNLNQGEVRDISQQVTIPRDCRPGEKNISINITDPANPPGVRSLAMKPIRIKRFRDFVVNLPFRPQNPTERANALIGNAIITYTGDDRSSPTTCRIKLSRQWLGPAHRARGEIEWFYNEAFNLPSLDRNTSYSAPLFNIHFSYGLGHPELAEGYYYLYNFYVIVDEDNRVVEDNEDNNTYNVSFRID